MSGDDKKLKIAFLEALGSIPAYLLSTKEGVGMISILIGSTMKSVGFGKGKLVIKEKFRGLGEKWLWETNSELGLGLVVKYGGDEEKACMSMDEGTRDQTCELTAPLIVDVFPFDLPGVKPNLGNIPIPDLLIAAGFLAMSAEFVKGVAEFVPF